MQTVFIAKVNSFVVEPLLTTRVRQVAIVLFRHTVYRAGSTSRNRAGPSLCREIALSIDNYRSSGAERCNFAKLVREQLSIRQSRSDRSDLPASDVHVAVYSDASPGIAYHHGEIVPIADIVSFRQVNRTGKFILSRIPVSGLNSSVIRKARCRGSTRDSSCTSGSPSYRIPTFENKDLHRR